MNQPVDWLEDCLGRKFTVGDKVVFSTGKGQRVGKVIGLKVNLTNSWGGRTDKMTLLLQRTSSIWNINKRHTFEYVKHNCLKIDAGTADAILKDEDLTGSSV